MKTRSALLALVAAVSLGACNVRPPAALRPVSAPAPQRMASDPLAGVTDLVFRWECPADGAPTLMYLNDAAYRALPAWKRAQCSPIPPTHA